MIKSWQHKGLKRYFDTGSKAGIQAAHAEKLSRQLSQLDEAVSFQDMNVYGWNLHVLKGDMAGHYSVKVNGNWRMTFAFDGENAILVDYQDYH